MDSEQKKQSISLDSTVLASNEQVTANLDGEVVILGFQSSSYFGLDQVGAFVWDLLQKPHQVVEIRDRILDEYDIDLARCELDLLSLLGELLDKQLIEVKEETPA